MALLVFDNQEYCISLNIFLSLVLSFKRSIFVHPNGYEYPRFWRRDNGGVGLCFDSLRSWKAAYSRDLSEFYRLSISLNGYGLVFFSTWYQAISQINPISSIQAWSPCYFHLNQDQEVTAPLNARSALRISININPLFD
jgi:hypothetical protein